MLHETEADTTYDRIVLNFESQDGSFCTERGFRALFTILDSITNANKRLFSSFSVREVGIACDKGLLLRLVENDRCCPDDVINGNVELRAVSPDKSNLEYETQSNVLMCF